MDKLGTERGLQARIIMTFILLGSFVVGLGVLVGIISGNLTFTVIFVGILTLSKFYLGKRMILEYTNGVIVDNSEYPNVHSILSDLSEKSDINEPRLVVIEDDSINAFSLAQSSKAVICVTSGLINSLDNDEIRSVVAREIYHIRNRDAIVMTSVATVEVFEMKLRSLQYSTRNKGRIGILFSYIFKVSRLITHSLLYLFCYPLLPYREIRADKFSIKLTDDSEGLKKALQKIKQNRDDLKKEDFVNIRSAILLSISPSNPIFYDSLKLNSSLEERIDRINTIEVEEE